MVSKLAWFDFDPLKIQSESGWILDSERLGSKFVEESLCICVLLASNSSKYVITITLYVLNFKGVEAC